MPSNEVVQGKSKHNIMRPGVNDELEDQIEESLENLDNLLTNIKSNDPKRRENEIMKLGQKFNIDLNNIDNDEKFNYGKANNPSGKVFEYQQPFQVSQINK